jgi:hypothetical protein
MHTNLCLQHLRNRSSKHAYTAQLQICIQSTFCTIHRGDAVNVARGWRGLELRMLRMAIPFLVVSFVAVPFAARRRRSSPKEVACVAASCRAPSRSHPLPPCLVGEEAALPGEDCPSGQARSCPTARPVVVVQRPPCFVVVSPSRPHRMHINQKKNRGCVKHYNPLRMKHTN